MKHKKPREIEKVGTVQWLMMQAVKQRPEPYVTKDFLIFNDATVRFEITVKIIQEEFLSNANQPQDVKICSSQS
jgi:hypothetical protein